MCLLCFDGYIARFLIVWSECFYARPLKNSSKLSLHGNEFSSLILYKLSKEYSRWLLLAIQFYHRSGHRLENFGGKVDFFNKIIFKPRSKFCVRFLLVLNYDWKLLISIWFFVPLDRLRHFQGKKHVQWGWSKHYRCCVEPWHSSEIKPLSAVIDFLFIKCFPCVFIPNRHRFAKYVIVCFLT